MVEQNLPAFIKAFYRNTTYQFWVLQLIGWFGLCLISFLSLTLWYNQQSFAYIAHTLLQSVLGILVSWPLRPLFHYFWDKKLWSRLIASVAGVLACSLVWTMLRITTFMAMTGEQGLWNDFGGWLFGSIMIFSCWAAFYYGAKFYQLLQSEHATLLRIAAENKEQQLRRSQAEAIAHEAQLKMLRYQLNPHFLFNTLNSIASLVGTQRSQDAQNMIAELSTFLRFSLESDSNITIPLRDEIEALDHYLRIEQVRFSDRLVVEQDIDPSALAIQVPSLVLQPLVENAIKHAIGRAEEGGCVRVMARRESKAVVLSVEDSGSSEDTKDPNLADLFNSPGFGLRSTAERLENLYGDMFSFNASRSPLGGLKLALRLPTRGKR